MVVAAGESSGREYGSPTDAPPRPAAHPGRMDGTLATAERLVEAIAARDLGGVMALLAPDASLRYLVPKGPAEIEGAAEAAATFLEWFGDADVLEVKSVRVEPVVDRMSVRYRFLMHEREGWEVVEQQMYLDM